MRDGCWGGQQRSCVPFEDGPHIMRGAACILMLLACFGCSAIPTKHRQPSYHNPFPQLHRIAILPFFNLSEDPHVHGERVALTYFEELQAIPGFEVQPIGVTKRKLELLQPAINEQTDFQKLAAELDVDAVLVGAVTDFTPYYPPRMSLTVKWYAANPGFHPVPAGYGLPWGTSQEEFIPKSVVWEAEFALAREQLATQTPVPPARSEGSGTASRAVHDSSGETSADKPSQAADGAAAGEPNLPAGWPDPRGFIPPGPSPTRPEYRPQNAPIIQQTRIYHGDDLDFTSKLEDYFILRDDARFGGWQGYLQRSEDFVRFCCYLHITETLAARGGVGEPKVLWRWPISRYDP